MNKKENILIVSAAVFAVVAIVHLLRLIFRFDISVGGESISLWVNVLGVLFAGYLALANFRLIERANKIVWLKFAAWLVVVDGLITFYSWAAGLSYWGLSNAAFGWITIFDLVLASFIFYFTKRSSAQVVAQAGELA